MRGFLFLALFIFLGYVVHSSLPPSPVGQTSEDKKSTTTGYTSANGGQVHYKYDDTSITYAKGGNVDTAYMIYGFQTEDHMLGNGYLALVPIPTAKRLLANYPDMDKCGGEGSELVKNEIINTMFIYNPSSPGLRNKAKTLETIHGNSPYRICLHLKGSTLSYASGQRGNNPMVFQGNNTTYLYLSDMQQVSCNQ